MNSTVTTPDEQILGPIQASRLSSITGLPASEFEGKTVNALSERLRWEIDPDLWLFRRVCGRVVQTDPATGLDLPVANATVEVFDTVCDYWGFFPEPWPWGWLFPTRCERQLVATVVTDACGNFCFWIPRLRNRMDPPLAGRACVLSRVVSQASVGRSHRAEVRTPNPPDPAQFVGRLRVGGDLAATLGARAEGVLSAVRSSSGFGDNVAQLGDLLRSPAFTQPVAPPLPPVLSLGRTKSLADYPKRSTRVGTSGPSCAVSTSSFPSGTSSSKYPM